MDLSTIRQACERLPTDTQKPEHFVSGLLFPLLKWAVGQEGSMVYNASPEALKEVDQNFDGHVSMQASAFLKPGQHEESKYHGKLRTKFDRCAVALHQLNAACLAWKQHLDATPRAKIGGD